MTSPATAGQCRCSGSRTLKYTRDVATLRAVLGETAFDAAWAVARWLPIEQAIVQHRKSEHGAQSYGRPALIDEPECPTTPSCAVVEP